jgi:hypothetical protein
MRHYTRLASDLSPQGSRRDFLIKSTCRLIITGLPLSKNFSKVFLRKVRKEKYMGHESGNVVEPDLRKKPARTKGKGCNQSFTYY